MLQVEVNGVENEIVVYLSGQEAALKLGCAAITVSRVARRTGIGVFIEGGKRLAALSPADLDRLRPHLHATSGNPVWIAAGKTAKKKRKRA